MSNPVAIISKGRARPFWFGCPVVFSGSVARIEGNPEPGELIDVKDDRGQLVGRGFFNPSSSYRVRLVGGPADPADATLLIRDRIQQAWALRSRLGLPSPENNVYRLFNSEGDGLSGLTIDIFDRVAVVMESAFWTTRYRGVVGEVLWNLAGDDLSVIFRVAAGVRGLEAINASDDGQADETVVVENGLRYLVAPGCGQKTGFYADQRENRRDIRRFVRGARVLDLFCFRGGFAMNAAAAGAASVTAVDSSAEALAAGKENLELNGIGSAIDFRRADVIEFLKDCGEMNRVNARAGATWDVVVCDPPKLASGRSSMESGLKHYTRLNAAALRAVADGGIFVTCSCSSVVRRDRFIEMVRDAAAMAGRQVTMLSIRGAGPDHPVNPAWTEGEYLKVATLLVRKGGRA